MKEYFNESEILREMATLCSKQEGFGIIVIMHSDDHEPRHVHLLSSDKSEYTKIEITDEMPTDYKNLIVLKGCNNVSSDLKKRFLEWAGKTTIGRSINNWEFAKGVWFVFHNNTNK